MKLTLLKNRKVFDKNFTEIFGLSRSGKTTLLNSLKSKGKKTLLAESVTSFQKLINFIFYFLYNPLATLKLFLKLNSLHIKNLNLNLIEKLKILKLRNSYLLSVLAKNNIIRKINDSLYLDEFSTQL